LRRELSEEQLGRKAFGHIGLIDFGEAVLVLADIARTLLAVS